MSQAGLRTLLIEPEPLMADITSYRLGLLDYQVIVAATAAEVWPAIDRAVPHTVLLNLDAKELDGFGLLEQFASDVKTSEIPILVLSADADLDRVERAWKAGARDYLLTPYNPLALEQKLARLLEGVDPEADRTSDAAEVRPDDELILAAVAQAVPTIQRGTEAEADEHLAATDLDWSI